MSRQPIDIQASGRPYGRRAVWGAIRKLQTFTRVQLKLEIPQVGDSIISDYLQALARAGYVEAGPMVKGPNMGSSKVRQYRLARDTGLDAPRLRRDGSALPPTAQHNMWLTMKIIGLFDATKLAALASSPEVPVNGAAAEDYIKHLRRAGYLSAHGQGAECFYRLVNNTGGLAPMVQRTKVVFDPNENRIMWNEDLEP